MYEGNWKDKEKQNSATTKLDYYSVCVVWYTPEGIETGTGIPNVFNYEGEADKHVSDLLKMGYGTGQNLSKIRKLHIKTEQVEYIIGEIRDCSDDIQREPTPRRKRKTV